jgi:hypothetical protein
MPFIGDTIDLSASIHTDGSAAYNKLSDDEYKHRRTVQLGSDISAHDSMPEIPGCCTSSALAAGYTP